MEITKEERDNIFSLIAEEILKKYPHPKDKTISHLPREKVDKIKE